MLLIRASTCALRAFTCQWTAHVSFMKIYKIFFIHSKIYISLSMTHRQCKRLYNIYYYLTCPNITPVILYRYITPVVYKMVKRKSKTENGRSFLILYYSFFRSLGRTFVPFPQERVESLWNVSLTVWALSAPKHNTCYIYLLRKV